MAINGAGAASGAASGATAGAAFGPWGMAIGAVVGGVAGASSGGQSSGGGGMSGGGFADYSPSAAIAESIFGKKADMSSLVDNGHMINDLSGMTIKHEAINFSPKRSFLDITFFALVAIAAVFIFKRKK